MKKWNSFLLLLVLVLITCTQKTEADKVINIDNNESEETNAEIPPCQKYIETYKNNITTFGDLDNLFKMNGFKWIKFNNKLSFYEKCGVFSKVTNVDKNDDDLEYIIHSLQLVF